MPCVSSPWFGLCITLFHRVVVVPRVIRLPHSTPLVHRVESPMGLTERRAFTTPNFPRDPIVLSVEHDADVVPLRTGCRLWSASYALVDHLSTRARERVLDKRVLELGAGVGACGLACASLGARAVCLTDRDEATLALAHGNARRNGWFDGDARANACEVTVRRLDWSDSTTYATEEETYDVVVAADMLYLEEHVEDLANAVDAHAGVDGTFIAAFGVRRRELTERFVDALRARGMTVTMTPMMCVNEEMRMTAEEHEHDDEIASRGGYALLEAARERGAEAADAALADAALADFAEELEAFSIGACVREGDAMGACGDEDASTSAVRVDFSDACACAVEASEAEVGAGAPEAGTVERAAESLRTHGFVIIRASSDDESLIPERALRECAEASDAHLNELLARVGERGVDATTDIFRFAEICSRARGGLRYDFTRPESDVVRALATDTGKRAVRAWETVQISCAPWIEPVLAAAYGDDFFTVKSLGCVSSEPGAPEQHFHADGRSFGIFNVFVPVKDVQPTDGPTEFIHGSHAWDHDAAYVTTTERKSQAAAPRFQPHILKAGSMLVYDYRVMHRGGANESKTRRALAYVMYCSRETRDSWNFPLNASVWAEDDVEDV